MCGIGGIWKRSHGRAEHLELRRMMSAMGHRGPEGAAFGVLDHGALRLGFLRLGFTGEGVCNQPLYDESQSVALVYNGEIYGYEELRRDLEARGHRFQTTSDSEVIVHLYTEHGEDFFRFLNGEFAFVLWDSLKDELLLVRDRFGVKPLHYSFALPGTFAFASEAKGLFALSGFPVGLDPDFHTGPGVGLAECSMTPFQHVRSVRPGHVLRVSRRGVRETAYWEPRFGGNETLSIDEAAAAVREALTKAVARRLEGDPPLALSLSSGIDSTIIAGLAAEHARLHGRKLTAFSVGYDDAPYDESAVAQRTAAHFGLGFERVRATPEVLLDGLLPGIHSVEVPTNSFSTTARLLLTRAVRRSGLKAVMSGEGSDELFGGYPYFGVEAIWRMLSGDAASRTAGSRAFQAFRQVESKSRGMFWDDGDAWKRAKGPFGYASSYAQRIQSVTSASRWMFSRDWLARRTRTPMQTALGELDPGVLRNVSPFDATRLVARSVLGSLVIPSLGDRVEMAHSLEGRVPFLDLDVVELAYSLPERFCLEPGTLVRKHVLRRAFADLVPAGHRAPPKHTLMAPTLRDVARKPRGRELLESLTGDRAIRHAGIFDPTFVRALRAAWSLWPEARGSAPSRHHTMLDLTLTYVLTTQALHHVHVEDALARRDREPHLALDEDRSPTPGACGGPTAPTTAVATIGGAS